MLPEPRSQYLFIDPAGQHGVADEDILGLDGVYFFEHLAVERQLSLRARPDQCGGNQNAQEYEERRQRAHAVGSATPGALFFIVDDGALFNDINHSPSTCLRRTDAATTPTELWRGSYRLWEPSRVNRAAFPRSTAPPEK